MRTDNAEQAEYWGKSASGTKWLTYEERIDAAFVPVTDLLIKTARLQPGERVLDIGCGTGASLIAAANRVGPKGRVLGADISTQLVNRARSRIADLKLDNAEIRLSDAQVDDFGTATWDALISRFGMMFFGDTVAALANLARALKPGGRMAFAAWGPMDRNPWFSIPHKAATTRLGQPPKSDRNAPGPLAFHDVGRVLDLMEQAGLSDLQGDAVPLNLTPQGSVEEAAAICSRIGPAARVLAHFGGTAEDEASIQADVADHIRNWNTPNGMRLPAVINLFTARKLA